MRSIRVWWSTGPEPGNLGDILTPVLLRHFGYEPVWTGQLQAELLCVGSIIKFARPGMLILGSGAMWSSDRPSPEAQYLAVRGPLTQGIVEGVGGECSDVVGDPALLMPLVYDPPVRKKYDVGVVPHYVDHEWANENLPEHRIINILGADPLEVIREILECRAIWSSSLHGLILAHAYGIPAAWAQFSDKLSGDGTKFADYAQSVGVDLVPHGGLFGMPALPDPFDTAPLVEAFRSLEDRMELAA